MNGVLKAIVMAMVAFAAAVLTFLIANETNMGNTASSIFAGVYTGLVASIGFQIGSNDWTFKSWFPGLLGGVLGGVIGGILFAFGS